MNSSLREIGNVLKEYDAFYIFPHIMADADAMGSAVCLCRQLRAMHKTAYVLVEDETAKNLRFLTDNMLIHIDELGEIELGRYVSIIVDCGSADRFPRRREIFEKGHLSICLDHHVTSTGICHYNYIDSSASATGVVVYRLFKENGWNIDERMAEALFCAITTDTGNFQYSNTNKECHEIMSSLYDIKREFNSVSIEIYERVPIAAVKLQGDILSNIKLTDDGRGISSYVSQDMLKRNGADMDDCEGMVGKLRAIENIEIAALLKEEKGGKIKVSLRSKNHIDVSEIAERHNGGGHKKAAGFTLHIPLQDACKSVMDEIEEALRKERTKYD